MLKQGMAARTKRYEKSPVLPQQVGLAAGMLEACFAGNKDSTDMRHSVLAYLFGVPSMKMLGAGEVLALLDWLKPIKDSGGASTPDPMAVAEAQAALHARFLELGQGELLL